MGRILTGISSWADRGLIASDFYPDGVKTAAERLQYYGQNFPVAEIDGSYHYFPTKHNLELWLANSPEGFNFDIKAFSLFTGHPTPFASLPHSIREGNPQLAEHKGSIYPHHLTPEALNDLWLLFSRTLQSVERGGKLGAVLFQFPHWFHPGEKSNDYLKECRERLPHFRIAVEFRAGAWLDEERREATLRLLHEHNLTLVCVDEPQGFRSSIPPLAEVTAPLGYIRFHGRNGDNWEGRGISGEERFRYLYDENELREWIPKIRHMEANTDRLHIIFKNKYADYPIRNARQLNQLLAGG
jgi:uncharacterized protein YecE (DUF72 family)